MKKVRIILLGICIVVFVILFGKFLWDGFFSNFFPWTKTRFKDYQEYIELIDNQHFYASYRFINEIPAETIRTEYYVKRDYKEKYAAHSMVLADEYEKIAEERINPYLEYCSNNPKMLIYTLQENRWGMEDLKQAGAEVDFIQNVMQNPDAQQEYYCLVVVKIGSKHRIYTGVILNDTTHEIIEFSVEVPEREPSVENEAEAEDTKFSIDTVIGIGLIIKNFLEKLL